ncbi:glycosyltransferase family 2 protein [Spirosoma horti]
MHQYNPLISVIIAVYNGALYIEGAIKSVISQSYKNFELIIIDGGSKDGTTDVIKRYKNYIKYTVSERDKGIYEAWNKGLKMASGDWVTFIGSDDVLYPDAIESYVNYISLQPDKESLDFVSSKIEFTDEKLNVIQILGEAWTWPLFKERMITWHVGTFHAKKLFLTYGLFDDTYKISGDYELLLRPMSLLKTAYLPKITVRMRDGGISSVLSYKCVDEIHKAKRKHRIISPLASPFIKVYTILKYLTKKGLFRTLGKKKSMSLLTYYHSIVR